MDCSTPGLSVSHHLPVCPSSCPLNQWCHPAILSSVIPFSFCLQSFPASGSFPRSQLFALGGQSIGTSTSVSVLPMSMQHVLIRSIMIAQLGLSNLLLYHLKAWWYWFEYLSQGLKTSTKYETLVTGTSEIIRGQKRKALRVVTRDKHQIPFHNLSRFSLVLFWNKCCVISLHR